MRGAVVLGVVSLGGCGPRIVRSVCGESLTATDGCVVEPSQVCLTCEAQRDVLEVCSGDRAALSRGRGAPVDTVCSEGAAAGGE